MMLSSSAARRVLRAPGLRAAVLTAARSPLFAFNTVADDATPAIAAEPTPTVASVIGLHYKLSYLHRDAVAMRIELEKAQLEHAKSVAECKRQFGFNAPRVLIVGGSFFVTMAMLFYGNE